MWRGVGGDILLNGIKSMYVSSLAYVWVKGVRVGVSVSIMTRDEVV